MPTCQERRRSGQHYSSPTVYLHHLLSAKCRQTHAAARQPELPHYGTRSVGQLVEVAISDLPCVVLTETLEWTGGVFESDAATAQSQDDTPCHLRETRQPNHRAAQASAAVDSEVAWMDGARILGGHQSLADSSRKIRVRWEYNKHREPCQPEPSLARRTTRRTHRHRCIRGKGSGLTETLHKRRSGNSLPTKIGSECANMLAGDRIAVLGMRV